MDTPRKIALHAALVRPRTLGGADRRLVICVWTGVIILVFAYHWLAWTVAVLIGGGGHWLLRRWTQDDPDFRLIYARSLRYQSWYPAQPSIHARPARVLRSVPTQDPR